MLKHREYRIDQYIDLLELHGVATIPRPELYQIYNCERLTKIVFRDILQRWNDLCALQLGIKTPPKLTVLETWGALTFIRETFSAHKDEKITPIEDWT